MSLDPPTILADAWDRLNHGKAGRDHPFRNAALATADALGRADVRTVVLRRVGVAARTLDFQTDYRSPKCSTLQRNGAASWLFWDSADKVQLRLTTTVALHTGDAIADAEWDSVPDAARRPYCSPVMPGAALDGPDAPPIVEGDGRLNFVIARCTVDTLEWLRLDGDVWRRLRFTWPGGTPHWQWLAP